MNPESSAKVQLARQVGVAAAEAAKAQARTMPAGEVGDVLREMAGNEKASVRTLVLELASEHPSEGASRAILSRLQDPNLTVRSIANSQIARIAQKNLVPDLFKAMEENSDLVVKGALVRQIGMIGDATSLPRLRQLYRDTQDPGLRNDIAMAAARLGDEQFRHQLIQRLTAPEETERAAALRDIPYVGDPRLARYFRPVLEDRRDVMVISFPHDPVVTGRVCDLAVQTLAALGVKFSFAAFPTRRFTDLEIQEAIRIVTALEKVE